MKLLILFLISGLLVLNASTGFLKGETTSGMNKICLYDVLGSTYTLNVKSYEICPITHEF